MKTLTFNLSYFLPWRIFLRVFYLISLGFTISLLVFTFSQISSLAKETASLRNLEQKLNLVSQENKDLRFKSVMLEPKILAENLIEEFQFEKVEKIHFITPPLEPTTVLH